MIGYFKVYLTNGYTFEFDRKCNRVKYGDGKLAVFIHVDEESGTEMTLAMIPYENILYILNIENTEE